MNERNESIIIRGYSYYIDIISKNYPNIRVGMDVDTIFMEGFNITIPAKSNYSFGEIYRWNTSQSWVMPEGNITFVPDEYVIRITFTLGGVEDYTKTGETTIKIV